MGRRREGGGAGVPELESAGLGRLLRVWEHAFGSSLRGEKDVYTLTRSIVSPGKKVCFAIEETSQPGLGSSRSLGGARPSPQVWNDNGFSFAL